MIPIPISKHKATTVKIASLVNRSLSHIGVKLVRLKQDPPARPGNAYHLDDDPSNGTDVEVRKLLNLVAYTTTNDVTYNAKDFQGGYHTLRIAGHEFRGQRDPEQRLHGVPFSFDGASVLDLGCNQGGMLFSIADRIKFGVGVDYDYKMINTANWISAYLKASNLNFYVLDLERENLELLKNFIPGKRVDIVFLLSVCMWIKNWKEVISFVRSISTTLLFESNGSVEQQREQEAYLRTTYAAVTLVREASTDDPGQQERRLFLCSGA